jgi:hypothetical protein
MRWSSEVNFLGVSLYHRAALFGTWLKSKLGWPLVDRAQLPARNLRMSGSGGHDRLDRRIWRKKSHRRRDKHGHSLSARYPRIDDIRPLLHHMAPLNFVLSLFIDATR